MKVLMLGWEFPPFNFGGLGTACYGLTKALSNLGVSILFVLPKKQYETNHDFVELEAVGDMNIELCEINSLLEPYISNKQYEQRFINLNSSTDDKSIYGESLIQEVKRYANLIKKFIQNKDFDVIHAHDWLTYKAGIAVKELTGKPLIVHCHATDSDRCGNIGRNEFVYGIENDGFKEADKVIAVSEFTRNKIIKEYDVPAEKVEVAHNGVDEPQHIDNPYSIEPFEKTVLFLGRITIQKGPEFFVKTAQKVLQFNPNVKFIVAGSGDMTPQMINMAAEYGISDRMLFAGYLRGEAVDKAYQLADVYVMPSVSEPFGITPLEAIKNGTPVIISKQSGVSEVLNNCFKADFWDIDKMADHIISLLNHKELHEEMLVNAQNEIKKIDWTSAANKCKEVYSKT